MLEQIKHPHPVQCRLAQATGQVLLLSLPAAAAANDASGLARRLHTQTDTDTHRHRYPPMTRTFFPDGSLDLEWVDTSLRMVDLETEQPRYKHGSRLIQ